VALVRTDISEKSLASVFRVVRISKMGTTLDMIVTAYVIPSSLILFTLVMETICSTETSVLSTATRRYIQKTAVFKAVLGNVAVGCDKCRIN
jgi:hypothetical protein